ncbi:MAG: LPS assembly protein LptD, partial [Acetobacterales bacterium]
GDVVFADHVEITSDLREGIARGIRVLLSNDARFAANGARLTTGSRTEMSKGVYSPCDLCPADPDRPPFWQIKALRIVHDKTEQTVEYYDATLEFAGIPVAYLPYFSHYDPTVQRRSGFLPPSVGSSSDLGLQTQIPYFWAISPNRDFTFEPVLTSNEGPVLAGEYRERLGNGAYQFSASVTRDSKKDVRGHLYGEGQFNLNEIWRTGFDVQRSTDDTYLRRYNFATRRTLVSDAYVEGFNGRNFARLDSYAFQGLRLNDDPGRAPLVLPRIRYEHFGLPQGGGRRFDLRTTMVALSRSEGIDTRHFNVTGGWHIPYQTDSGQQIELAATVQGDLYHVDTVANPRPVVATVDEGVAGRVFPQLSARWSWPFIRTAGVTSQVIEPIAAVIVGPDSNNTDDIPNEDSLDFEYTDVSLFQPNRFVGDDRVDGGQRIDYGLNYSVHGAGGGRASVLVGQSYRLEENTTFAPDSGLREEVSDIVGRVELSPASYLNGHFRFRLDHEELAPRFASYGVRMGPPALNVTSTYTFIEGTDQIGEFERDREEIFASIQSRLTDEWSVGFRARHDLGADGGMVSSGAHVSYNNECFILTVDYDRSFTSDRDVERDDSIILRIVLKTLGELRTAAR